MCWGGATGLLNEGGGEQQASCLVAKQAVEFPQVYTSNYECCIFVCMNVVCLLAEQAQRVKPLSVHVN